ncbi:MAG: hypothetical protein AABX54_01255 [Nanoarchaeota archaeon]
MDDDKMLTEAEKPYGIYRVVEFFRKIFGKKSQNSDDSQLNTEPVLEAVS